MHSSGDAVMDMCAAVCVPCCVAAGFHYHLALVEHQTRGGPYCTLLLERLTPKTSAPTYLPSLL